MENQLDLALARPGAAWLLVCCALAAGVLFRPVALLFRWRPGWTLLALLSLAPILVFTAPLEAPGWQDGGIPRVGGYVRSFLDVATFNAELDAPASPDERLANLLLFIPLGLFGTLATRRAISTAVAGAALSFGVEGWQAVSGVRVATAADWLYNSGGALLGAAAGLALLGAAWVARQGSDAAGPPPAPMTRRGADVPAPERPAHVDVPARERPAHVDVLPPERPAHADVLPPAPARTARREALYPEPARHSQPARHPEPARASREPLEPTLELPAADGDETTVNLTPGHNRNGGTRLRVPPSW